MTNFIKFKDCDDMDCIIETSGLAIFKYDLVKSESKDKLGLLFKLKIFSGRVFIEFFYSTKQERDAKFSEFERLLGLSE